MRTEHPLFPPGMLAAAILEPWESALAEKWLCPKCSDSLKDVSTPGLRAGQCLGCSRVFVLEVSAPHTPQPADAEGAGPTT